MGNVVIIGHVKSTILIEHPRWHISREVTYEIFSLIACVRVFTKQVVKALAENKWLVCIYPLLLPRGLYYYNEVQKRNPIHSILYTARQSFAVGLKLPLYECEGNRLKKRSLGHHVYEGRKKQVRRLANGTRW